MNEIDREKLEDLFVDYQYKGLDENSKEELDHLLSSSRESKDYWGLLCDVWLSSVAVEDSRRYDKDKAYRRLMGQVKTRRQWEVWRIAGIAASFLLVALLSFVGGRKQVESTYADIVMEAPEGSRAVTTLPDGSRICLNAGAKLTYSQGFGVQDRKVFFTGEGFFDVAKNGRLPFVITSDNLIVSVLGTEFSIRDNPADREIVVSLFKGNLRLENRLRENDIHDIIAEDMMVMDKQEGIMHIKSNSVMISNKSFSENGYMIFDEMPLSDILNSLHLNYGASFIVKDDRLLDHRYRGIFIKDEQPVEDILKVLVSASGDNLHFKKEGGKIILY